jgi:hypothetical protein
MFVITTHVTTLHELLKVFQASQRTEHVICLGWVGDPFSPVNNVRVSNSASLYLPILVYKIVHFETFFLAHVLI